jgi:WD40 repeat protein
MKTFRQLSVSLSVIFLFSLVITACARPRPRAEQRRRRATLPRHRHKPAPPILGFTHSPRFTQRRNRKRPALQRLADIKVTDPAHLTWSPDGKSLGAITQSGFSLISAQSFQPTRTVAVNQPANLLDLSPDLRLFAQTSDQRTLELRDATSNLLLRSFTFGGPFGDAVFAPDGKTFAVTSMDEIAATLWDVQTGQQTKKLTGFQTAAPVYQVAFSADGKTLLWISRGTIQLMDIATANLSAKFQHEDFIFDHALTPDGRTLITAAEGTVIFWDVPSGNKSRINPPFNPTSIALSPGGRVLAIAAGNNILLWDAANQKYLRVLAGHADRVTSVAFAHEA